MAELRSTSLSFFGRLARKAFRDPVFFRRSISSFLALASSASAFRRIVSSALSVARFPWWLDGSRWSYPSPADAGTEASPPRERKRFTSSSASSSSSSSSCWSSSGAGTFPPISSLAIDTRCPKP